MEQEAIKSKPIDYSLLWILLFVGITALGMHLWSSYKNSYAYKEHRCENYVLQLQHTVVQTASTATDANIAMQTTQQQLQDCKNNGWRSW